jgi:hypothetical protein
MNRAQKVAVGVIVAVPVVCCLGGILTLRNGIASASGTLEPDLQALRKRGFPTEPADLVAKKPISSADNGAPIYTQVSQAFYPRSNDEFSEQTTADGALMKILIQGSSSRAKPADRVKGREAFQKLSKYVTLAEQAADRPGCDFKRDWSKGFYLEFPEFRAMKDLARLLAYKAELQSKAGDWQGSLRSVARAQRIAQHAGTDGTLIGMLVQVANETIALSAFRRIVDTHDRNPAFLTAADKTLKGFGSLPDIRRTMGSELVLGRMAIQGISSLRDISKMSGNENGSASSGLEGMPLGMLRGAFEARLVREYARLEPNLPRDPEEWAQSKKALVDMNDRVESDKSPMGIMNQIMMPIGSQAADAVGKLQAERRLTATALYLLQARLNGPLPKSLPADPKISGDPFGTGALHYLPAGGGFTLYSNGPDRKDSGGKIRSGSSSDFDVVVKFR